jgi:serine/threonine protein kinase/Tfp pilus assembly protein PilF
LGQVLDHYRLTAQIGHGGMGIVYRACDERLQRDVAVKVLHSDVLEDAAARSRFSQEALLLSKLNHPNIATIFDFNSQSGVDYIVMEFVPGLSLDHLLLNGPLPHEDLLHTARQLVSGLRYAHAHRVIHRDLKPGNLRITPDNLLKILDFGLAQLVLHPEEAADAETLSRSNTLAGTLPYMAPEQLAGRIPDERCDIYAVGVVLYELATGIRPFPQQGPMLVDAILHKQPPSFQSGKTAIPPALGSVIRKCLNKDARHRYQSADELADALESAERKHFFDRPPWLKSRLVLGLLGVLVLVTGLSSYRRVIAVFNRAQSAHARRYVAVLPFRAQPGDTDDSALSAGLSSTVTNRLMQLTAAQPVQIVPAWEVETTEINSVEDARKKLGANLVIDGLLQRNGDDLQINLGLTDVNSRSQLRADSVSGHITDLSKLENGVLDAVVRMLELELHRQSAANGEQDTTSSEALGAFLRGKGYLANSSSPENVDSAIAHFVRALSIDPGYAAAHALLGTAYGDQYRRTKDVHWLSNMQEQCDESLKLRATLPDGHICLGLLEEDTGKYLEAASQYELALDEDPQRDIAYQHLASVYQRLGRQELAERTFQKAIHVQPQNYRGYVWLGSFYAQQAHYKDAALQLEEAVSLAPGVADPLLRLGGAYLMSGKYDKADSMLQRAIKLEPSYEAYSNLGEVYFFERKFPEAISAFEQSVALGPRQIQAYGNLARAYYWYPPTRPRARPALERAVVLANDDLRVNPDDADVHTLISEYYAMLGDREKALTHLRAALHQHPDDPETQYFAAKVYNLLGSREQALQWLRKSVDAGYSPAEIRNTVELDSLRSDPTFVQMTQHIH